MDEKPEEITLPLARWQFSDRMVMTTGPSRTVPASIGIVCGGMVGVLPTLVIWNQTGKLWLWLIPLMLMAIGGAIGLAFRRRFEFGVDRENRRVHYWDTKGQRDWELDDTWEAGVEEFDAMRYGVGTPLGPTVSRKGNRVYLRSLTHGVAFYLFEGNKADCNTVVSALERVLPDTASD